MFYFKGRFCYTFKCPKIRHILKSLVGLLLWQYHFQGYKIWQKHWEITSEWHAEFILFLNRPWRCVKTFVISTIKSQRHGRKISRAWNKTFSFVILLILCDGVKTDAEKVFQFTFTYTYQSSLQSYEKS